MEPKHIGFSSPVSTVQLRQYLHLNGSEPVGTEGATAPNLLIIELLKLGKKISVFSLSREIEREYVVKGECLTIYYLPFRHRARHYALDLYSKERKLLKEKMLEVQPEVIHAQWQYEYAWAALDTGIKTIVTCRDSPVRLLFFYKRFFEILRLAIAYSVLRRADIITAPSTYLESELKKFGVRRQIRIIPNFEPDWIFEAPIIMNKDLKKPIVIMINNGFDARKNVGNGLLAFQKFRESYPAAVLHLYGHGYEVGGLAHNWATKNNLSEAVTYMGYKGFDELIGALRMGSMLLHPSKEETFGNILTESMALGVPVIGGIESGAVPWVIGKKQTGGVLVNVNCPDDINRGMLKIFANVETYNCYTLNARKHAKEYFSSKPVVEAYLKLY
jgi:glycosyltransferase involved in cell wall biosynthesis